MSFHGHGLLFVEKEIKLPNVGAHIVYLYMANLEDQCHENVTVQNIIFTI